MFPRPLPPRPGPLRVALALATLVLLALPLLSPAAAAPLLAGIAKAEITDRTAGPVRDPSFVKALVLKKAEMTVVLITVDAVAIGEIGRIPNDYLAHVRAQLQRELGIAPGHVVVNASHCHSIIRGEAVEALTLQVVREAAQHLVPVRAGAGVGQEDRISENRRLQMKDGSQVDMRRAYSLPRDEEIAAVGPIDPQIGLLRLDREDGRPLAVLYNFACHPIMNAPGSGNTADFPGAASQVIEETLGDGAIAFFLQGCAGDLNPVRYKDVTRPPEAEPLGHLLGLSVLRAWRPIQTKAEASLQIRTEITPLPRGADLPARISAVQAEQAKLVASLKPTDINFKSLLPLLLQQSLSPQYPSFSAQGYLHDRSLGRDSLEKLDAVNRQNVTAYLENINTMERLTRLNVNLALLKRHLAQNEAAGHAPLPAETVALRVGDFTLITFPGELTVETGLELKRKAASPFTFIAGYTNGYLYYLPTEAQRHNTGYAQEDCDCVVAPEWQRVFMEAAERVVAGLKE